ncbi:MAG: S41 family peptidase [Christensenellales bacterium]
MEKRQRILTIVIILLVGLSGFSIGLFYGRTGLPPRELTQYGKYAPLEEIVHHVNDSYYEDVEENALLEGAMRGAVAALNDPYSVYLNKAEFQKLLEKNAAEYIGIGVQITKKNESDPWEVQNVFSGSPAEKAGIQSGDFIIKINRESTAAFTFEDMTSRLKGAKGQSVLVGVKRSEAELELSIIIDNVVIPTVKGELIGDIGYIKIISFSDNTSLSLKQSIDGLKTQGAKGYILDLRDNLGGLLSEAVNVADILLPEGIVVTVRERSGEQTQYNSDVQHTELPFVLLVNGYSASASEVVAGAVKDFGAGKIIGVQTYGKGLVQTIMSLYYNGAGLKITSAVYYTPNGTFIGDIGVTPDIISELPDEFDVYPLAVSRDNDIQMQKAVEILRLQMQS